MLSHVILGINDVDRALDFYDQVLGALGIERRWSGEVGAGYGLGGERHTRNDALKMIRRRAKAEGIETEISPHSFRATGIALFGAGGGSIDETQQKAAHAAAPSDAGLRPLTRSNQRRYGRTHPLRVD